MAYENSGRLFRNDKRDFDDPNAKQPHYTGDFTDAAGKKWRLAAWLNDGTSGKYLSIKASEPRETDGGLPS
jgi:hypothetical protein